MIVFPPNETTPPLLSVQGLRISYPDGSGGEIEAVRGVSFEVAKGAVTGLVGESGSGKSTIARALVRLIPIRSGTLLYDGHEIGNLRAKQFLPWRKRIQMIFQDPLLSLNPRLQVHEILAEPFRVHFPEVRGSDRQQKIDALLERVGLDPSAHRGRYPSELSGGQRQRIGIARALAVEPELLICDEPVSALDVSVQAQIINLLRQLRADLGLTLLFIAHDLAVVENLSDEILVMRRGEIVERGTPNKLYHSASHPYTRELLAAAPRL